jgi:hypothetical protein
MYFEYFNCIKLQIHLNKESHTNFHRGQHCGWVLTLILLTWNIGWDPNNTRKWQRVFNSVFKGLRVFNGQKLNPVSLHFLINNLAFSLHVKGCGKIHTHSTKTTRVPLPHIFYCDQTCTRINHTIPLDALYVTPCRFNPRQSQLTRETTD